MLAECKMIRVRERAIARTEQGLILKAARIQVDKILALVA
jgi:hypothetical protein